MTENINDENEDKDLEQEVLDILDQYEYGDAPDMDTGLHLLGCGEINMEYLRRRVYDVLTSYVFGELLCVNEQLHLFNTEEATNLSKMMWNTLIVLAERRIQEDSKVSGDGNEVSPSSFFQNPGMPWSTKPEDGFPQNPTAHRIFAMPSCYTDFLFQRSKVLHKFPDDPAVGPPRVVFVLYKNRVYGIYSDTPMEYVVLRHIGEDLPVADEDR